MMHIQQFILVTTWTLGRTYSVDGTEEDEGSVNECDEMDNDTDDSKSQGSNGSDDGSVKEKPPLPFNAQNVSGFNVSTSTFT
jgi:hypothetical protein